MSLSSRPEIESALFPQFNDFPPDIRQIVWEYCIPLPRVVVLTHEPIKTPVNSVDEIWAFRSQTPVPDILFVNRESYHIATRFYERSFMNGSREGSHTLPETWFDFKRDILYLPQQHIAAELSDFLSSLPRLAHGNQDTGGFNRVENLALPIRWLPNFARTLDGNMHRPLIRLLGTFGGVKNVYFIAGQDPPHPCTESDVVFQDGWHLPYRCIEMFEFSKARDTPLLAPEPFPPYSVARHIAESESFVVDGNLLDIEREKWNDDVASLSKSFTTNITDERDEPDKRHWEMPSFETKILVSRDYQEKFEAQRLEYLKMIEENVKKHKNHKENECNCGPVSCSNRIFQGQR
ncbi:hypothetical protein BGAL_0585g00020 [Botrytis galanthina]|uniref:2EXR domain-containing protein n=1 Tax=Botrytis galanthina TaxID=278940 RepID=A0A4V4HT97_9HELO|nr:hypothetical protein BGAL_0585g00020 [Botrytis galanthina]